MDKTTSENSVCESCGETFHCGAVAQECWCFQINLTPENLTELRENYIKCLCRECLENQTSEKIKPQSANQIEGESA